MDRHAYVQTPVWLLADISPAQPQSYQHKTGTDLAHRRKSSVEDTRRFLYDGHSDLQRYPGVARSGNIASVNV